MEFVKQIETLFHTGTAGGLTDGQLLEQFLERRGEDAEAAFAALVDRHAAMVLRICRQILGDEQDAEDAAQATFLVLAKRAGTISRRESLGCWLHGVALRVAANVRIAAARRRKRERRGGEMRAAGHAVAADLTAMDSREDWAALHDELGSLPQAFREPLILCYLDGLSQEQAAAQLRCPLGTIQSRLARGRQKLKARLEKRGVGLASAFAGAGGLGQLSSPVPQAWAEATVRLSIQIAHSSGPAIAGAASVVMARHVLRGIALTRFKVAAAIILLGGVLVSGATSWAIRASGAHGPRVPAEVALAAIEEPPEAARDKVPPPPDLFRIIRGIVRDEFGQPVAKAWIGGGVGGWPGSWQLITERDRIRERQEPFRDEQGKVVSPGALGKYFELKDEGGKWQPIHPADIRRFVLQAGPTPWRRDLPLSKEASAIAQMKDVFEIRSGSDRLQMLAVHREAGSALRAEPNGQFEGALTLSPEHGPIVIHFASPDFARRAIAVIRYDDPDRPFEITLKPVRRVRARVIETPKDHPEQNLHWNVYALDPSTGGLDEGEIARMGEKAAHVQTGYSTDTNETASTGAPRLFEAELLPGRYKIRFDSDTMRGVAEINVSRGNGPLDLPDFQLESTAWFKMLGKPATEIDAFDLGGKPVRLANFRDKALILCFWSSKYESENPTLTHLAQIQKKFAGKPLAILVLHDASITSLETLNRAVAPLRTQLTSEPPVYFLLDRPPGPTVAGPNARRSSEDGSGRTITAYETNGIGTTLVIDKSGNVASATVEALDRASTFSIGNTGETVYDFGEISMDNLKFDREFEFNLIARSVEDVLGLPRSPFTKPKPEPSPFSTTQGIEMLRGRVVDLDGKPIAAATVADRMDTKGESVVSTGKAGEFAFRAEEPQHLFDLVLRAQGFASRRFKFEVIEDGEGVDPTSDFISIHQNGKISEPLTLGPGVLVRGKVLKNGKPPVAGLEMGLKYVDGDQDTTLLAPLEAKTDSQGSFRIPHVPAAAEFWVYAKVASVPDGGAVIPIHIATAEDGSTFDIGECHVEEGRTLAGRVICSDGKQVPTGSTIFASHPNAGGGFHAKLGASGKFEFNGLPPSAVRVYLDVERSQDGAGYHASAKNRCLNPSLDRLICLEGQLDHDINDLTILLEPGAESDTRRTRIARPDPTALADFNDAKAGPITGVPPRP